MPPRSKINEPTYIYVRWLLSSFPSVKRAYASASYVRTAWRHLRGGGSSALLCAPLARQSREQQRPAGGNL